MKFSACLASLEKNAGLLDAAKNLALKEVPGTKPWLIRPAAEKASLMGMGGRAARPGGATRVIQHGSGARTYDVSALAQKMGIK